MKMSTNVELNRQDIPEAPSWINKLLYPLQLFMIEVRGALTSNLSFQDNVSCVVKQIPLQAGASDTDNILQFSFPLGRQPITMSIYVARQDGTYEVVYPQVSWNYVNNNIMVNGINGLTSGKIYNITFVVY